MIDIPDFYKQIINSAGSATLSVVSKDGSIQSTLVWADYDGQYIKLNMLSGSPKAMSIKREKKATLLIAHNSNENLYISIRCELHKTVKDGAIEHLDFMTQRNMGLPRWFGGVEPEDSPRKSKYILMYLKPVRIYHT